MISEQIKALRNSYNINQAELANRLGVTKQCVSNWENDNIQPSIEMLIKLSKYFNVSTDYLLRLSPEHTINVDGLNEQEITHLKLIINDLKMRNSKH